MFHHRVLFIYQFSASDRCLNINILIFYFVFHLRGTVFKATLQSEVSFTRIYIHQLRIVTEPNTIGEIEERSLQIMAKSFIG